VVALHNDVTGLLTGAAVVPGIAHTLRYGVKLFVNRILAGREKARVGLVYGLAAHRIKERLDRGEQLRADGFFDAHISDRSSADEIAEAVLIAAQKRIRGANASIYREPFWPLWCSLRGLIEQWPITW
jgi:hypothetical protein